MKRIALRLVLALVLVVVVAVLAWHNHRGTSSSAVSSPLTGVYADDWQASCGKETGAAQEKCTAGLNARYGRAEDVPVPK